VIKPVWLFKIYQVSGIGNDFKPTAADPVGDHAAVQKRIFAITRVLRLLGVSVATARIE
jgi:hypothetical protein